MEIEEEEKVEEGMKLSKWKQIKLPIAKQIVSHLRKKMNFNKITKVQREVIPLFVKNKDL